MNPVTFGVSAWFSMGPMPFKRNDPAELQAFVKLMTEHQGNLRAFIISLMPGSPDVGDVLQETNTVLWEKRRKFKLGTNFLAWAFQIARYEVKRQRARTRRDGRLVFSEELVDVLAEIEPPRESDEELMTALDGCLARLSDKQQTLIKERYTPGHSLEQYAARTGSSPGSLRIALLRVREALKRCIVFTLAERSA